MTIAFHLLSLPVWLSKRPLELAIRTSSTPALPQTPFCWHATSVTQCSTLTPLIACVLPALLSTQTLELANRDRINPCPAPDAMLLGPNQCFAMFERSHLLLPVLLPVPLPVLLSTQTLELAIRDLINPRPAPDPMLEASLRKALQLSRMTLFEIDATLMEYVNLAHNLLLANMWRYRQPAAAVSVARHALTNRLMEKTTEQTRMSL